MTTSIARLVQQGTGDNDGTWGLIQGEANELLEKAFGAVVSVAHNNSASMTLTSRDQTIVQGATAGDQTRAAVIIITGTTTDHRQVVLPDSQKTYVLVNKTTNNLEFSAGSGRNATIADGKSAFVYCDGDGNIDFSMNSLPSLAIGSVEFTASGSDLGISAGEVNITIGDDDHFLVKDSAGDLFQVDKDDDGAVIHVGANSLTEAQIGTVSDALGENDDLVTQNEDSLVQLGENNTIFIRGDYMEPTQLVPHVGAQITVQGNGTFLERNSVSITPNGAHSDNGMVVFTAGSNGETYITFHKGQSGVSLARIDLNADGTDIVFTNSTGSVSLSRLIQLGA